MNIVDYVDFRGDITFKERPFNEVDNLIFSELSYVEMDDFISSDGKSYMTISELREAYSTIKDKLDYPISDPWPLLDICGKSERFGNIPVKYYVKKFDYEKQYRFTAVTFFIDEKTIYVAYRGTDGNIDGWRECFNLSYLNETEGQKSALEYLNRIASLTHEDIIVGGHSKGGNFAEYAAVFSDEKIRRERIKAVYTNDGPGFSEIVINTENYKEMLPITHKITPEASFIGCLLEGTEDVKIIKGEGTGLIQHDPFHWSVRGTSFELSDRKASAAFTEEAMRIWIDNMDMDARREFTEAVFDMLYGTGVTDFSDIHKKKLKTIIAITRSERHLDPEKKATVKDGIKNLGKAARQATKKQVRRGAKND